MTGEKGEKIWEKAQRGKGETTANLSWPPSNRAQIKSAVEAQNLPCRQGLQLSDDKDINDLLWVVELRNLEQ